MKQHRQQQQDKGEQISVGDIVVLKTPPQMIAQQIGVAGGVSTRLLPRFSPTLYRVSKQVSPQNVILHV